jgi:ADP-ribosyl-[dinitrogen reductase] hydrolase
MRPTSSHALGAVLGALVGDAAGAVLEFRKDRFSSDDVRRAMRMPGGGCHDVLPGQITDDGELTLALRSALAQHGDPSADFPSDAVASAYAAWFASHPIDVGTTCAAAFDVEDATSEGVGRRMAAQARLYGSASEANGALMRATPIATFYSAMPEDRIARCAALDAALSHPNVVCCDANALYCVAIAWLVNHPGDHSGAVRAAERRPACDTVKRWLEDSKSAECCDDCTTNAGHVKHAFTLAFRCLRRCARYENAIFDTLMKRGDTDTNAAIVGGILGALHGVKGIPDYMLRPVLRCQSAQRPSAYWAVNACS